MPHDHLFLFQGWIQSPSNKIILLEVALWSFETKLDVRDLGHGDNEELLLLSLLQCLEAGDRVL